MLLVALVLRCLAWMPNRAVLPEQRSVLELRVSARMMVSKKWITIEKLIELVHLEAMVRTPSLGETVEVANSEEGMLYVNLSYSGQVQSERTHLLILIEFAELEVLMVLVRVLELVRVSIQRDSSKAPVLVTSSITMLVDFRQVATLVYPIQAAMVTVMELGMTLMGLVATLAELVHEIDLWWLTLGPNWSVRVPIQVLLVIPLLEGVIGTRI